MAVKSGGDVALFYAGGAAPDRAPAPAQAPRSCASVAEPSLVFTIQYCTVSTTVPGVLRSRYHTTSLATSSMQTTLNLSKVTTDDRIGRTQALASSPTGPKHICAKVVAAGEPLCHTRCGTPARCEVVFDLNSDPSRSATWPLRPLNGFFR